MIHFSIMPKLIIETTDLYSPEEAAEMLKKGRATIYRWIKKGDILPIKIGGRTLIPKAEILKHAKE